MKEDNTFWELNRNWKKLQEQIEDNKVDGIPDDAPEVNVPPGEGIPQDDDDAAVNAKLGEPVSPPKEELEQPEQPQEDDSLKTCGSIFSGIGGWEFGAKQVGLKPIFAFEFNQNYADAYKKSHGDHVTVGDVQQTHTSLTHSAVDVLFASPPCQNFSGAKHRKAQTVIKQDAKTDVGIYVVKVVEKTNPKVIFIENVVAYLNHPDSPLKDIVSQLSEKYHVHTMIIDAHVYGCPTSRKRMLATFVRKDLYDGPFVPSPTNKVEDAKSWIGVVGDLIPKLKPGKVSPWQQDRIDRWAQMYPAPHPKEMKYPLQISGNNVSATAFKAGKPVKVMRSFDEPSFTIVKSYQAMEQTRIILEDGTCLVADPHCFARWQGFPDEVFANLPEDPKTATEMIGNAVPPQLCISVLKQLMNIGE
jgi:DNA (cytosine-5)-methyltransferase 1